jgi:hypothetical protein
MKTAATPGRSAWRGHAWFGVTALGCAVAFAWMVTFGKFRFVAEDSFGSFYDHQAAAWLKGHWDVPEAALQGESFIVKGKVYGYFGPTPAVLRLPLVALGIGFASTTRMWMLVQYVACLGAAYALLQLATRWRNPTTPATGWAVVVFTAITGLGSTLFFLGGRAFVYHEAILCGAAFALWSVWCALRFLESPASRWWVGALACGVFAIQARPPIGLFALLVIGGVAASHAWRQYKSGNRKALRRFSVIGGLGVIGILSFSLVSYVKFETTEGCPLRYNVQYTPEQLAVLGHRNFHLSNLRFNADTYLRRPVFSLSDRFPYIYREFINRREYPESRMAYRDPVLALPWSMPALVALAAAGSVLAFGAASPARGAVAVLWMAGLPSVIAMLTAVAVTQRYTADFVPLLIGTGAFGLVAIEGLPRELRLVTRFLLAVLTVAGAAVTLAITLHYQGKDVWGVPEEVRANYAAICRRVDQAVAAFRN